MKIVHASAEHVEAKYHDKQAAALEIIAKAGRTCYKSPETDNIGNMSFAKMLMDRKHFSVLEHANIMFDCYDTDAMLWAEHMCAQYANKLHEPCYLRIGNNMVSGNVRAWRNFIGFVDRYSRRDMVKLNSLLLTYDVLFGDFIDSNTYSYGKEWSAWHEVSKDRLTVGQAEQHRTETARFIVDRGISHEIVRHRPASFCQESTRYCNYSKKKFSAEIACIVPEQFEEGTPSYNAWVEACEKAEYSYFRLLDIGELPQMARNVLPTSVKTEVIMTATVQEWNHFFELRALGTTGQPHPQMAFVAGMLLEKFAEDMPEIFGTTLTRYEQCRRK